MPPDRAPAAVRYRAPQDMTERQLDEAVRDLCRLLGLYAYHTHDSRHSEPGFPDWVIVGPGGILYREHKTRTGKVSKAQQAVMDLLAAAGADVAVRRPADLLDGSYARELQALTRPKKPSA